MSGIPEAPIVRRDGRGVVIRCPYCGEEHRHEGTGHRAPGCGWRRTPDQRVTGYRIRAGRHERGTQP